MKYRFLLQSVLAFFLLLAVAVYLGRLLELTGDWRLDLGAEETDTLAPRTLAFLDGLEHNLSITYFVSSREQMPSHLKDLEEQVRRLLAALRARAPRRIEYRVIYPEQSGPPSIAYAARKKASSFSVRRVLKDEHGEQRVWSSLILAYGNSPEQLIQGVENSHLPYLEELIVEHLNALARPLRPTFAVASPPGFQLLPAFLSEHGRVIQVDLDRQPRIPPAADVLFWMQPAAATPQHQRQLRRFVDSGRTAVLAGSAYSIDYQFQEDAARYAIRPQPSAWTELLLPLGLSPQPDLLMDRNSGPVPVFGANGQIRQVETPFHLRCLPAFYDMKSFLGPARGGLNFAAASPLEVDPRRVAQAGFQAEIVGTTTEHAWVAALPAGTFDDTYLEPELPVPKQNLMVRLGADDPWSGEILVLASASPFQDGIINQPGYAHQVFLRTLMRTFAAQQRLARIRVERRAPPSLPPLSPEERTFWRFWAIFPIPLAFLALGLYRYVGSGNRPDARIVLRIAVWTAAGLILVLVIGQAGRLGSRLYLDLTEDRLNTSAPLTRQLLEKSAPGLRAELFITSRAAMPPSLKQIENRVRSLLAEADIDPREIRPEQLPPAERQQLRQAGLHPFPVEQVVHDTLTSRQVWSGLRLTREGRTVLIPRLDARTVDHLEFLLSAALQHLETGFAPRLAVVSDLPRLSPAEALEDYHRKGLIPPGGVDVYSELKSLLADYGYPIAHVNPRQPRLPDDTDLILWLQPRRDSTPIALLLSQFLARGGRAIVAMQHFNIQQRQYRGSGFQTVYWPQPQFQDLDRYLRLFGVEQVREVLMDRTQSHLSLETQVNRTAVREYDPQQVALPFLIRAVGAHFAPGSPITRRLGDLLFIWGNRFAVDPDRLRAAGLRYQVLITTSEQAWAYPWKGGWLPPQSFAPAAYLPGRQPLAILLGGRFPAVELSPPEGSRPQLIPRPSPNAEEGSLLLVGSSEIFKNGHLYAPGFQHDQFLLNAVAAMAYSDAMAALQARRPTPRGFTFQPPAVKTFWRLTTLSTSPLLFLLYGLFRLWKNRRPLRLS